MAIYTGEVSHKKELGHTRHVVATDQVRVAQIFGVSGFAGSVYSNGKIGMLQLEGETSHAEVAIDPQEMAMSHDYDYIKSHLDAVQNELALADMINRYDSALVKQSLASFTRERQFNELSNDERIAVVKYALGQIGENEVQEIMASTDDDKRLIDAVRNVTAPIYMSKSSSSAGVDFELSLRTGEVDVIKSAKQTRARIKYTITHRVSGSKAVAGAKFKQNFTDVKTMLTNLSVSESDAQHSFVLPDADIDEQLDDLALRVKTDMRQRLNKYIAQVVDAFADREQFNPASAVARIWSDLGMTSTDIPQTNLSLEAVRMYADGKITAVQFAEMPENNIVNKLVRAVIKRLETADVDALAEQVGDIENTTKVDVQRINRAISKLSDELSAITDFTEAKNVYSADNRILVDRIISYAMDDKPNEQETAERSQALDYFNNTLATYIWGTFPMAFPNMPNELQTQLVPEVTRMATILADDGVFETALEIIENDDLDMSQAIHEIYSEDEMIEKLHTIVDTRLNDIVSETLMTQLGDTATVMKVMYNNPNIYQHIYDEDYIEESAFEVTD
jgi:hypothetical protein